MACEAQAAIIEVVGRGARIENGSVDAKINSLRAGIIIWQPQPRSMGRLQLRKTKSHGTNSNFFLDFELFLSLKIIQSIVIQDSITFMPI